MAEKISGLERTANARAAWWRKFEDAVDPDRKLSESERYDLAYQEMRLHMARMALRAAEVHREKAAAKRRDEAFTPLPTRYRAA